jgi:hypothetical protein
LPGVPGIGEKTASRLISKYGSLDALMSASPAEQRLEAARPYIEAARRVVLPIATVPLPPVSVALPHGPADPDALARLASTHGLESPVKRVQEALEFGR